MGKLRLGSTTEMAQRLKNLENTEVLKAIDAEDVSVSPESDIVITMTEVVSDMQ
jgi:hypothetical protein